MVAPLCALVNTMLMCALIADSRVLRALPLTGLTAFLLQIFRGRIRNAGSPGRQSEPWSMLGPREAVLEQTWTYNEEDGVFDIVFASVEHPLAPPPPPWTLLSAVTHWRRPVRADVRICLHISVVFLAVTLPAHQVCTRMQYVICTCSSLTISHRSKTSCAQVHHMGITISPLRLDCWQSRGREPADAPESIVTIVARISLGGVFSTPWFSWLMPALSAAWLRPLLGSVVQARTAPNLLRRIHLYHCVEP